jgi:hypothetical protein
MGCCANDNDDDDDDDDEKFVSCRSVVNSTG